jgi:predicted nucleotidyltransferase
VLKRFLDEKKYFIINCYKPKKFILFGSRVWGTPTENSDIDLILVSELFEGQKFVGRMGKLLKELKYSEHIDALCYTPKEFERKIREPSIVNDAVNRGYNVI